VAKGLSLEDDGGAISSPMARSRGSGRPLAAEPGAVLREARRGMGDVAAERCDVPMSRSVVEGEAGVRSNQRRTPDRISTHP
jgi:hypothetical protein